MTQLQRIASTILESIRDRRTESRRLSQINYIQLVKLRSLTSGVEYGLADSIYQAVRSRQGTDQELELSIRDWVFLRRLAGEVSS